MNTNLTTLCGRVRLMRPERLMEINSAVNSAIAAGFKPKEDAEGMPERGALWAIGGKPRKGAKVIAVVPVSGIIDQKYTMMMYWMGGTSTDALGATIDQLVADPDVKGIILDVDSPGGTIAGLREVSQKIFDARATKPIVSISNSEMDSAAYWIGSAASRVFATPGAMTGSIGVWTALAEYSRQLEEEGVTVKVIRSQESPHKAELLPWEAFSQEGLDYEQAEVNRLADDFYSACAKHRGVSVTTVKESFGKGRSMGAKAALAAGLVDKICTLEEVAARMVSGRLNLASLNEPAAMELAFDGDVSETSPDESWKDANESERMLSRLRRKGLVAK